MATLEEIEAQLAKTQPQTAAAPSTPTTPEAPQERGFLTRLASPFAGVGQFAMQLAKGETPENIPYGNAGLLAMLLVPAWRPTALKMLAGEMVGGELGHQFGGDPGEAFGRLFGSLGGPSLLGKASTLAGKLPYLSQMLQQFSKTATKTPEMAEALGQTVGKVEPTIESVLRGAAETASTTISELTKFMDMASAQIKAAGANKQKIQQAASALAAQGHKAENIFKTIFGTEAPGMPLSTPTETLPLPEQQRLQEMGRTLGLPTTPFKGGDR